MMFLGKNNLTDRKYCDIMLINNKAEMEAAMNQSNNQKKPNCKTCYFADENEKCKQNKNPDSCNSYLIKDEFVMFGKKKNEDKV